MTQWDKIIESVKQELWTQDVFLNNRKHNAEARQIITMILRDIYWYTWQMIWDKTWNRSHATAMYNYKVWKKKFTENEIFRNLYLHIRILNKSI